VAPAPIEIDEYKIVRTLGRGGMGAVFLARDRQLDRLVAIKMIDRAGHQLEAVARFRIEARALGRLAHPNVVTVHRIGEHGGQPFIVYEYVEGTSLDQRPRPTAPHQAHAIALGLVRGLAAAHREGILHRDLKPGNAMLALDGTVKLLDFGLAKLRDVDGAADEGLPAIAVPATTLAEAQTLATPGRSPADAAATPASSDPPATTLTFDGVADAATGDSDGLTRVGSRMGTPRYMSPEAWRGEAMTARSDVYSLGLVLWELFADRHPFEGVALEALPARACDRDVPSLASAAGAPSPALVALIDRCVRRDPAARPADAVALLAELERIEAPGPAGPGERRRRRLAAAAVVVVLGGGSAAALWTRRGADRVAMKRPTPTLAVAAGPPTAPAAVTPRALTQLGACATGPVFIDASTIAFTLMTGDDVDVYTLVDRTPTRITRTPGWDWRPAIGRHPGEVLYVRDGDDGRNRIVAWSRAAATDREVAVGYAVAALGADLYYLTDDAVGEVRKRAADGTVTTVATLPDGRSPELLVATPGRLAVIASDRESPPTACLVELATGGVRCLPTIDLQVGYPIFVDDGRALLYAARAGIRKLVLDGGADTVIAPGVQAPGGLARSPNGARLVFSDCHSYGSIVAIAADGQGRPEVLVDDGLARSPRGGPAGLLAYVARAPAGGTRLMVKSEDGPARALVTDPGELGAPAFAGRRIAYAQSGTGGGLRVIDLDGGPTERWTDGAGDRGPTWTRGGGLAFTRLGAGGAPAAMVVTSPGAPPRLLAAGWAVQGTAGDGAIVAIKGGHVALLDPERPKTGQPIPLKIGVADGTVAAATVGPDGALLVMGGVSGSELFAIDRATGTARSIHQAPAGQTIGAPAVLEDGRVVYRAEIWLGELYELPAP